MMIMTSCSFYGPLKDKKLNALKDFVRKNFDKKIISMDEMDLVSSFVRESRELNDSYCTRVGYKAELKQSPTNSCVFTIEIARSNFCVFIGRFLKMDFGKDTITPLEVEYTEYSQPTT